MIKLIRSALGFIKRKPYITEYLSMVVTGTATIAIGAISQLWGLFIYGAITCIIYITTLFVAHKRKQEIPVSNILWVILSLIATAYATVFYFKIYLFISILSLFLCLLTCGALYKLIKSYLRKSK